MFTGIVTDVGTIRRSARHGLQSDLRLEISGALDLARLAIGASVACSGVCLTVVDKGGAPGDAWFAVDVSDETLSRTAADHWHAGARLNLEPSLRLGDELGGHIVTGHVDAVGTVTACDEIGGSIHLTVAAPADIAPYVAEKGSITADGVSLTVNAVRDEGGGVSFDLNIIPHTAQVTTLGAAAVGTRVNLEIDVLARYLQRMQTLRATA